MTEHRWSKFWWQDYEADPALRLVSLAAQGLWMRMLCAMHRGEPYGHLTVAGKSMKAGQLAALVGSPEREVLKLLAELEGGGVFSRSDSGVIFNRRLVRDRELSDQNRTRGLMGGHPELIRGTVPKDERIRRYRKSDSPEKTMRIFARDGGCCHWCGVKLQTEKAGLDFFHVDHVVAVRDGGGNEESNLVAACAECNGKRAVRGGEAIPPATQVGIPTPASDHNLRHPSAHKAEAEAEEERKKAKPPLTPQNGHRLPDPMGTGMADLKMEEGRPTCGGFFVDSLFEDCCAAAGINSVASVATWQPLIGWLTEGHTEWGILRVIKQIAGRPGYKAPRSREYFNRAVREEAKPGERPN